MKKLPLVVGACVAGYLATVFIVDRFDARLSDQHLVSARLDGMDKLTSEAFKVLNGNGCQYCHTSSSELPFYASLPVAKQLMDKDIEMAQRQFNIESLLANVQQGKAVSEVDLAKIESVMQDNAMPPNLYLSMHWRSRLSDEEKGVLLDWVKAERLKQSPAGVVADAYKYDAVKPITSTFPVDPAKVALGEKLYHDTRLSADDTVSCASCHALDKGGVDRLDVSVGVGGAKGPINSPTVFNSVFNLHQFWDGRAADLQEQAGGPPMNPLEMASTSWQQIVGKLTQDAALSAEFAALYPAGISADSITDAIAEFEKTLVTPNSRFDLFLKGRSDALSSVEKEGYELFKTAKCATCHVGEAMGGQSFELMGVKKDYFADRGNVSEVDHGRYNVTRDPKDMYRFKVPTLRNVALTAPYFHDASARTLEEAVDKMAEYQVGVKLSEDEVGKIVAFLNTLNGEYQGKTLQ
ncbi:cytochrome c peroxidase [Azotobacter salinestris]|uniref:cytochrome c peroxidase n=1 Tax=Azotobacter salinestris TaxID=69964 RepID=UPI001266A993|nr:cytochrome c peroxidase [Azotobacter salinestris]